MGDGRSPISHSVARKSPAVTVAVIAAGVALASLTTPVSLAAQRITVSGIVADASRTTPIPGATVRLSGTPAVVTDSAGRFRTFITIPGRDILSVDAIGYRFRSHELSIGADTTLRIEMERQSVLLDPMIVRAGNVTVRGSVRDAESGDFLVQAQVTIYPGAGTIGTTSGDFTFEDMPRGEPITLVFEALEHLPKQLTFVPGRDTSLVVALDVDSVGMRLIAQQVRRLVSRFTAVPTPIHALNRDEIRRSNEPSIGELVRHQLPPGSIRDRWPYEESCVFYDDQPVTYDVVMNLPPELIERVEIQASAGG